MSSRTCLTIVLAAGEGTRMRSRLPKVLHPLAGEPMLTHVLRAASGDGGRLAVVVGPGHDAVTEVARRLRPDASQFVQAERLGTAHAVLAAREALADGADDVVVAFGDTPLITADTFVRLRATLADGATLAVLGFRAADPTGYGRLIVADGRLQAIREHADASEAERAIDLCNAGVMAFAGREALSVLERIGNANSKGEYYLTDAVAIVCEMGHRAVVVEAAEDEVRGINTKAQLAQAEQAMQSRLRAAALDAGVTLAAPETVFLAADTVLGRDVVIEPYVVFGPKVAVGDGAVVHAFSHLTDARVGAGASVGPYARLRPGTVLGKGARIGNFVETKAATIDAGAKVNHLTYIGDAHIGAGANIGAGTITCNYDGYDKHRTEIGAGAFVGSNSSLVAPVTVGAGAYIGSGSVVTDNVPKDALRVERSAQTTREGWAGRFRERKEADRADRSKTGR
jgi:bifunctional UDP-N-acetylglucosamine pyrophosphorylase/glucosamine-1-phosphate N-acetyltransferase